MPSLGKEKKRKRSSLSHSLEKKGVTEFIVLARVVGKNPDGAADEPDEHEEVQQGDHGVDERTLGLALIVLRVAEPQEVGDNADTSRHNQEHAARNQEIISRRKKERAEKKEDRKKKRKKRAKRKKKDQEQHQKAEEE